MVRSRLVFLVLCLAVAPQVALAQGIAKSFDELRLLVRPGDTVTVTDSKTGTDVKGKIFTLSASSLILTVDKSQKEWREGDVSVIHQNRGDSLKNGALWGFAIGGALGVAAGVSLAIEEDDGAALAVGLVAGALYGGIGAGIGVGIDALVTTPQVIYAGRTALEQRGASVAHHRSRPNGRIVDDSLLNPATHVPAGVGGDAATALGVAAA